MLAFSGTFSAYKCGNYETCSILHLSYRRACCAGFRRRSTALSGETYPALQRPRDHYREQLALNITEQRAKITGVNLRATLPRQRLLIGEWFRSLQLLRPKPTFICLHAKYNRLVRQSDGPQNPKRDLACQAIALDQRKVV